ncbi:MAG: alpha-ketoacid dehydrogenase subunit beta, partial [Elusimicrobia bacterium]|nr:alpha-ketoacid dehydrogenase subunit beta [Elusimicrobiota bacterium]
AARSQVPRGDYRVELGKARLAREGRELTLIGWGAMVQTCLEAAELLAGEGRSIEVLDLRTLTPLDLPALLASVEKTGRAVIAHEAPNAGSWAAELSALISERALLSLQAPVRRVGGWDIRMPLFRLEDYYVPDRERVADAARQTLAF